MSPVSAPQERAPELKEVKDLTAYYGELLRRLRETPGVQSASLSFKAPISNEQGSWWSTFAADGRTGNVDPAHRTYLNAISPEYFSTIGMPLLAGRDFTLGDREGAPPVVIINASLARELFGNEPPVGRYVLRGEDATRLEVVGVVRDVTYQNLVEERRRIAYLPYLQQTSFLRARNLVGVVRIARPGDDDRRDAAHGRPKHGCNRAAHDSECREPDRRIAGPGASAHHHCPVPWRGVAGAGLRSACRPDVAPCHGAHPRVRPAARSWGRAPIGSRPRHASGSDGCCCRRDCRPGFQPGRRATWSRAS